MNPYHFILHSSNLENINGIYQPCTALNFSIKKASTKAEFRSSTCSAPHSGISDDFLLLRNAINFQIGVLKRETSKPKIFPNSHPFTIIGFKIDEVGEQGSVLCNIKPGSSKSTSVGRKSEPPINYNLISPSATKCVLHFQISITRVHNF